MRLKPHILIAAVACTTLILPGSATAAAGKEDKLAETQRDVAAVDQQVKDLQKATDAKFAEQQKQLQQLLDAAAGITSGVTSMNSGVTQTVQSEVKTVRDQLKGLTDLSVKVENTARDVSDIKSELQTLETNVNGLKSLLTDVLNQIKLSQAPPVAPPALDAGSPPPMASTLYQAAIADQNSGKHALAISEFAEFLRLYPNDPNAIEAKFGIGESHYQTAQLSDAVQDFDAVINQYPENIGATPKAWFMKGMAYYKQNTPAAQSQAAATFRGLIAKYPSSDYAAQATKQLKAMGLTVAVPRGGK